MFFGGAVISQENRKYINKNKIEKEKRCVQLKKLMDDYINHMADHPRISFSGMMYYGKLSGEYNKLKKELEDNKSENTRSVNTKSVNTKTENKRELRNKPRINYKE